jgi:protein FAM50
MHRILSCLQEEEEEEPREAAPAGKRSAAVASTSGDEAPSTSGAAEAAAAAAPSESAAEAAAGPASKRPKFSKLGKDPGVQTAFLPDKDRELQEQELKQRLREVREGATGWLSRGAGGEVV